MKLESFRPRYSTG